MARGSAVRKGTNVSAPPDLVAEAKSLGINLSHVFERALQESVRDARQKRWMEENREGFDAYDRFVERHGIFSQGKRLF